MGSTTIGSSPIPAMLIESFDAEIGVLVMRWGSLRVNIIRGASPLVTAKALVLLFLTVTFW